jgi:hypothetical protein
MRDSEVLLGYYIDGVIVLLMLWLVVGAWRLRRRRATPGAAAAGMMHEILTDERRAAIEIIVEERTAYRDPEDRDGNFPGFERVDRKGREESLGQSCRRGVPDRSAAGRTKGGAGMIRISSSFCRGMVAGIMAWAVVCGLGALLADLSISVPSYIRLAGIVNICGAYP